MECRALIFQITAKKLFQLNGTNHHTMTFGTEADISNLCPLGWYKWVYFWRVKTASPYQKECVGRCLVPAKNEGNAMAQGILKENGKVVPWRLLCHLSPAELAPTNEVEVEKLALFNTLIRGWLGDSVKIPNNIPLDNDATEAFDELWDLKPYEDDHETKFHIPDADLKDASGKPFENKSLADTLINAEVCVTRQDKVTQWECSRRCKRGVDLKRWALV
jgi:hypothetical protein